MELKPCPFCGKKAEVIELKSERPWEYFVACTRDKCVEQRRLYRSKKSAVDAWNRRKGDE